MWHVPALNRKEDHSIPLVTRKSELAEVMFAHFARFYVGSEISCEYRLIHDISFQLRLLCFCE
jgi:hypothetical protein